MVLNKYVIMPNEKCSSDLSLQTEQGDVTTDLDISILR